MLLTMVRHGESESNAKLSESKDSRLTELGRMQAARAGERLAREAKDAAAGGPIDALYCSPQLRALETAAIIARYLGLRPKVRVDLAEHGFSGPEPGLPRRKILARFPDFELPDEVDEDADSAGAQPDDARPDDAEREDAEREPDSASEGSDEHDSSAEDSAQPKGDADASADEVVSPDPAGSSPDSVAADQPDAEPSPTAPDTGNRVGRPDPVGSAPVTEPAQLPATTAAGVAAAPARPSEEESAP